MATGPKIESRIGVQAPVDIVWEILFDLENWPSWNPLFRRAGGRIGFGQVLTLELDLPGYPKAEITPTVVEWTPYELIHLGDKLNRWVTSTRYFEIDKLTDKGCIFAVGEWFDGHFAKRAVRPFGRALYERFEASTAAMKLRAETLWSERTGVPLPDRTLPEL